MYMLRIVFAFWVDALLFLRARLRSQSALAAENVILRKQLALYWEWQVRPWRASAATRMRLILLPRCFAEKEALLIVQPAARIRWHRKGVRLLWRWRSTSGGRPRVPINIRRLIGRMADENPTGGEERIAAKLGRELDLRVSHRTVRRYRQDALEAGMVRRCILRRVEQTLQARLPLLPSLPGW
jgi:hypothetical protein